MKINRLVQLITLLILIGASNTACDNIKDSDIENNATEAISTNPDASDVDVTVVDKVATLSGSVTDDVTKEYVLATIKDVKGVKSVVNNIMVIPPAPDYSEMDATLKMAMPDALKDHPDVQAEVKDGVVILTGEVKEKDLPLIMEKVSALNPHKVENNITTK